MFVPIFKQSFRRWRPLQTLNFSTLASPKEAKEIRKVPPEKSRKQVLLEMEAFFESQQHLQSIKEYIPHWHFTCESKPIQCLYLIDQQVAKKAISHILPAISQNENQIVCETNAGLGFISQELLDNNVKTVRLYESCHGFKANLKDFHDYYPGRVQLFPKDIFLLSRCDYLDKHCGGNRVGELLMGIPKKSWDDDPAMTIIGPMATPKFLHFLFKQIALQSQILSNGRFQLYVFMRPKDYVILTAGPHLNLHTYTYGSILANLFLDIELLDKFSRKLFLPWTLPKVYKKPRYAETIEPDLMYFAKINLKTTLPVAPENLLPLYLFITTFCMPGTTRIIPTLEKLVPGSGLNAIVPELKHENYYDNMDIFTQFGELTPQQILFVFREMMNHPKYEASQFLEMVAANSVRNDTIETEQDELLSKKALSDIKVNESI